MLRKTIPVDISTAHHFHEEEAGIAAAEYQFPMVHVRRVESRYADAASGYSGTEIYNTFADALLKNFGPSNSVKFNGTRIYNYDPKSLRVYIDGEGTWFSFSFNVDISCQPSFYCAPVNR
jgi:hypothetical protein